MEDIMNIVKNLLIGKDAIRASEATIRAGQDLIPPHPLTNFEIQRYQKEPGFNVVYSRNNLPKRKDGVCVINLNEYKSIGTHCKAFYVNEDNVAFFDSFGVEYISKEI